MDTSSDFARHFPPDTVVVIGVQVADSFLEVGATIRDTAGDVIRLDIDGSGLSEAEYGPSGAGMVITANEEWCICRCRAELAGIEGTELRARLYGPVEVQQRREFFRWDVSVPVLYSIPENQQLSVVKEDWGKVKATRRVTPPPVIRQTREGFKAYRGRKRKSVNPVRVNLSGNGIRLPTADELLPGTLASLEIYLPLIPARVIIAVGAVIRSVPLQLTHRTTFPFLTAFRFEFIDERDRDTIISYLFMEQRNLLRQQADERAEEAFPPAEPEAVE